MDELDALLSLVENPTRRQILERLVREPSYPLQLSRELGVSTQAVLKNLTLMEQSGLVHRTDVKSDMGPNRAVYTPSTEFTLIVDMRTDEFSAKLFRPDPDASGDELEERLKEIERRIEELDRERSRLENIRSALLRDLSEEPEQGQAMKTEVS